MAGLTTLGIFHTLFGGAALIFGLWALLRYREILLTNRSGQFYLIATLITALTSLGIFRHGGFGPPHALAILTLVALAVGTLAAVSKPFGGKSRAIKAVAYTSTILFHLIPGFTETLTRLPPASPLVASQDAPVFKLIYAVLLLIFLTGLTLQLRWLSTAPTRQ